MTLPAPTYDLVLLLDPKAEDDARAKIVADTRSAIEAQGELLRHDDWGERPLTLPDRQKGQRRVPPAAVPRGHARTPERPRPHAADHRRRRALPHHQAEARRPRRARHARRAASRSSRRPPSRRPPSSSPLRPARPPRRLSRRPPQPRRLQLPRWRPPSRLSLRQRAPRHPTPSRPTPPESLRCREGACSGETTLPYCENG